MISATNIADRALRSFQKFLSIRENLRGTKVAANYIWDLGDHSRRDVITNSRATKTMKAAMTDVDESSWYAGFMPEDYEPAFGNDMVRDVFSEGPMIADPITRTGGPSVQLRRAAAAAEGQTASHSPKFRPLGDVLDDFETEEIYQALLRTGDPFLPGLLKDRNTAWTAVNDRLAGLQASAAVAEPGPELARIGEQMETLVAVKAQLEAGGLMSADLRVVNPYLPSEPVEGFGVPRKGRVARFTEGTPAAERNKQFKSWADGYQPDETGFVAYGMMPPPAAFDEDGYAMTMDEIVAATEAWHTPQQRATIITSSQEAIDLLTDLSDQVAAGRMTLNDADLRLTEWLDTNMPPGTVSGGAVGLPGRERRPLYPPYKGEMTRKGLEKHLKQVDPGDGRDNFRRFKWESPTGRAYDVSVWTETKGKQRVNVIRLEERAAGTRAVETVIQWTTKPLNRGGQAETTSVLRSVWSSVNKAEQVGARIAAGSVAARRKVNVVEPVKARRNLLDEPDIKEVVADQASKTPKKLVRNVENVRVKGAQFDAESMAHKSGRLWTPDHPDDLVERAPSSSLDDLEGPSDADLRNMEIEDGTLDLTRSSDDETAITAFEAEKVRKADADAAEAKAEKARSAELADANRRARVKAEQRSEQAAKIRKQKLDARFPDLSSLPHNQLPWRPAAQAGNEQGMKVAWTNPRQQRLTLQVTDTVDTGREVSRRIEVKEFLNSGQQKTIDRVDIGAVTPETAPAQNKATTAAAADLWVKHNPIPEPTIGQISLAQAAANLESAKPVAQQTIDLSASKSAANFTPDPAPSRPMTEVQVKQLGEQLDAMPTVVPDGQTQLDWSFASTPSDDKVGVAPRKAKPQPEPKREALTEEWPEGMTDDELLDWGAGQTPKKQHPRLRRLRRRRLRATRRR